MPRWVLTGGLLFLLYEEVEDLPVFGVYPRSIFASDVLAEHLDVPIFGLFCHFFHLPSSGLGELARPPA